MSKKKNTLKDLDEFLKQQAATLVSPTTLSEKVKVKEKPTEPEVSTSKEEDISLERITHDLLEAQRTEPEFDSGFYKLIIKTVEAKPSLSPEDRMLINTALYLLHGAEWKEAIRQYWKEKA